MRAYYFCSDPQNLRLHEISGRFDLDLDLIDYSTLIVFLEPLLSKTEAGEKKVRLLGISVSNFDDQDTTATNNGECSQLPLSLKFSEVSNTKNKL